MLGLVVYNAACIFYRPWRHAPAVIADIWAHLMLVLIATPLVWFAKNTIDDMEQMDDDMNKMLWGFSFSVLPISLCAALYMIWKQQSQKAQLQRAADIITTREMIRKFASV